MNELLIRISSELYKKSDVKLNGQKQKFVDNNRGGYELAIAFDQKAEIQIERRHELLSPLWWLWGLLFFVISCFGIFDVPYKRKGIVSFKANLITNGRGVVQFAPDVNKNGKAVYISGENCIVEEIDNSLGDAVIKKRRRILSLIKLSVWLAIIAAVILIVIF